MIFSDLQYGFRSYQSNEDFGTVSDKTTKGFSWSETTRAITLDMSKAFDKVWQLPSQT